MKTLAISEGIHRQLMQLKVQMGYSSVDALEEDLISVFRKKKLHEASERFRKGMDARGLTLDKLLRESRKVRKELADQYDARGS